MIGGIAEFLIQVVLLRFVGAWTRYMTGIFELVYGPQDGGKVKGSSLPNKIYLGKVNFGDKYAAWSKEQTKGFPCCYELVGIRYQFKSYS